MHSTLHEFDQASKLNFNFCLLRDPQSDIIHLDLGLGRVVPLKNDSNNMTSRLLIGILRAGGSKIKALSELFSYCEKSISRIAGVFKGGGGSGLYQDFVLSQQSLPEELQSFIKNRYRQLLPQGACYRKVIQSELGIYWPDQTKGFSESSLYKLFCEADAEDGRIRPKAVKEKASSPVQASVASNENKLVPSQSAVETSENNRSSSVANTYFLTSEKSLPKAKIMLSQQGFELSNSETDSQASLAHDSTPEGEDVLHKSGHGKNAAEQDPCVNSAAVRSSSSVSRPFFTIPQAAVETPKHDLNTDKHPQILNKTNTLPLSGEELGLFQQYNDHLGLIIFYESLQTFKQELLIEGIVENEAQILLQVLAQILLGAVNNEQSRYLNEGSLKFLIGKCRMDSQYQRELLNELDFEKVIRAIYRANMKLLKNDQRAIFYDPHSVPYSGGYNYLKGFLASKKRIGKMYNIDFFHTDSGQPCFMFHGDNYYDPRERFIMQLDSFCATFPEKVAALGMLFIFDRGLFGMDFFEKIISKGHHFITWEKNPPPRWDDSAETQMFMHHRLRNNSKDEQSVIVEYFETQWDKNKKIRNIIFRVHCDKKVSKELPLLCSDPDINAEDAVRLMLSRWCQENDFKFMNKHVGLHQISTYSHTDYHADDEDLLHKMVNTKEYETLEKKRKELLKKIDNIEDWLFAAEPSFDAFEQRWRKEERIHESIKPILDKAVAKFEQDLEEIEIMQGLLREEQENLMSKKAIMQKQEPKMERLAKDHRQKINFERKIVMDVLRISARSIIVDFRNEFRMLFDNFRIDTDIVRHLSLAPGILCSREHGLIEVTLLPKLNLEPKEQQKLSKFLRELCKRNNAAVMENGTRISIRVPSDSKQLITL